SASETRGLDGVRVVAAEIEDGAEAEETAAHRRDAIGLPGVVAAEIDGEAHALSRRLRHAMPAEPPVISAEIDLEERRVQVGVVAAAGHAHEPPRGVELEQRPAQTRQI